MLVACGNHPEPAPEAAAKEVAPRELFDDFSYANFQEFQAQGWRARTEVGHPGVAGATWSQEAISFHPQAEQTGATEGMVRISSQTDGTPDNTQHVQFCHARKYLYGTYAARVYFRDAPTFGPDGDEIIETFYAISPLKAPMDEGYSEMDFEYLANGGWGKGEHALWSTTWETFQLEPWTKVNENSTRFGSLEGWHTLVMQASANEVRYFVDGELFGEHSAEVAPEEPMSINFNLWFTAEGLVESGEMRQYDEDIDWVYHVVDSHLSTGEVEARVAELRAQGHRFVDSVPEMNPPLPSPCGL